MKKYAINMTAAVQKCLSGLKKILKYNPGEKLLRAPFAIYLDLECLLKKKNNLVKTIPKNLTKRKKATHEPLGWAVLTKCLFDKTEDKFDY